MIFIATTHVYCNECSEQVLPAKFHACGDDRPFLFLDVDGVLNSDEAFRGATTTKVTDPKCIAALRRILDACNPEVVLSSTWRLYPDHEKVIWGILGYECARTPEIDRGVRGDEIAAYLADFSGRPYVILDDDTDMLNKQRKYHVKTDPRVGLTETDADHAIALFTRKAKRSIDKSRKTR